MKDLIEKGMSIKSFLLYGFLFVATFIVNWVFYSISAGIAQCNCLENTISIAILLIGVPAASFLSLVVAYYLKKRFSILFAFVISIIVCSVLLFVISVTLIRNTNLIIKIFPSLGESGTPVPPLPVVN